MSDVPLPNQSLLGDFIVLHISDTTDTTTVPTDH